MVTRRNSSRADQSLIPTMNFRLAQPAILLDINAIGSLDYVRESGDGALRIGALVRHRTLERHAAIARRQPIVREAAAHVAHPQIRNRGTLCGNLAHADPASELPAVLLALGAPFRARSSEGDRWIEAPALFATALDENEMLVEVEVPPPPPGTGTCFMEVARRPGDYAMMGVAAVVTLNAEGSCTTAAARPSPWSMSANEASSIALAAAVRLSRGTMTIRRC